MQTVRSGSFYSGCRCVLDLRLAFIVMLLGLLSGCGINSLPKDQQAVEAAWAQVQNEYQRRADLIPNLVSTVKGYAKHEKETLQAVMKARSKATAINVDQDTLNDPEEMQQYLSAQRDLSGALGRLLAVSERYPDLKANDNFLTLQSQLEGTENRISVARRDYIKAVQRYNTNLKTFPGRLWQMTIYRDMEPYANFKASADHADKAPEVSF